MDPSGFARLDSEMREVRRRLEERRHLTNLQKEAVNDIRRYRRRQKRTARRAHDDPGAALEAAIDATVFERVIAARDDLKRAVVENAALESRWSELVAERERRLGPGSRTLLDRLGEVEERRGVLEAQLKVAERVQKTGLAAYQTLEATRPVLTGPDGGPAFVEAVAAAQLDLLVFRREVKHLYHESGRIDTELAALLRFSDELFQSRFEPSKSGPGAATAVLRATQALVMSLVEEGARIQEHRRASVGSLEAEAATIPVRS